MDLVWSEIRHWPSGLDGVIVAFLQDSWDTIKGDLLDLFTKFHETGVTLKNMICSWGLLAYVCLLLPTRLSHRYF